MDNGASSYRRFLNGDDSQNKYLLDEKPVQKSEVEEYFENWNKNTTKVSWEDIN